MYRFSSELLEDDCLIEDQEVCFWDLTEGSIVLLDDFQQFKLTKIDTISNYILYHFDYLLDNGETEETIYFILCVGENGWNVCEATAFDNSHGSHDLLW